MEKKYVRSHQTGGKQYRVAADDEDYDLSVWPGEAGDTIEFKGSF